MLPIKEEDICVFRKEPLHEGVGSYEFSPAKLVAVLNGMREAIHAVEKRKVGKRCECNEFKPFVSVSTRWGRRLICNNCGKLPPTAFDKAHDAIKEYDERIDPNKEPSTDTVCEGYALDGTNGFDHSKCKNHPSTDVGWERKCEEALKTVPQGDFRAIKNFIKHQREICFREGQDFEHKTQEEMFVSREEACEKGKKEVIEKVREWAEQYGKERHGNGGMKHENCSCCGTVLQDLLQTLKN